jgi:hypothetical protein
MEPVDANPIRPAAQSFLNSGNQPIDRLSLAAAGLLPDPKIDPRKQRNPQKITAESWVDLLPATFV